MKARLSYDISMKVSLLLVIITLLGITESRGQAKQHYHAGMAENQKKVILQLNASSVSCRISPTYSMYAVNVFGYPRDTDFSPVIKDQLVSDKRYIHLNLEEDKAESFSSSLSARVFDQWNERREKPWYVFLSRNAPLELQLTYGMGSASVDLSGLSVEKFKVNTGSAEIRVSFDGNVPNKVSMDTLLAKVDMGVLELDKLNMARAQEIIADVGFGKLYMYLSEECQEKSNIKASVGAGTMEVTFENMDIPVIIHVNNSPLCRVKMLKSFREIKPETFVNPAYKADAHNLLTFDVDVSMGNVIFKIKE